MSTGNVLRIKRVRFRRLPLASYCFRAGGWFLLHVWPAMWFRLALVVVLLGLFGVGFAVGAGPFVIALSGVIVFAARMHRQLKLSAMQKTARSISRRQLRRFAEMESLLIPDDRRRTTGRIIQEIISLDNRLLVRTRFGSDRAAFVRQWLCLSVLAGKANVPSVFAVDEKHRRLYTEFVPGRTIGEIGLNQSPVYSDVFVKELRNQMNLIHDAGIAGFGDELAKVVIDGKDGSPWFMRFHSSEFFASPSYYRFVRLRRRDRAVFERRFRRSVPSKRLPETSGKLSA